MVFEKVKEIIAEQLGKEKDEITLETSLKDDLEADSLDLFQIINDIEDEFNIKIEETDDLTNVSDVVKLIESQSK